MFHKIKNVMPLNNYKLNVQFSEGVTCDELFVNGGEI